MPRIARVRDRPGPVAAALVVCLVVIGLIGYFDFTAQNDRAPTRAQINEWQNTQGFFSEAFAKSVPCEPERIRRDTEPYLGTYRCRQSKAGPIEIAIVGDSHAEHLFPGLAAALHDRNVAYFIRNGLPFVTFPTFARDVLPFVMSETSITAVILAAYWSPALPKYADGLIATIEALNAAGKAVYIAEDVPEFYFDPRVCAFGVIFTGKTRCAQSRNYMTLRDEHYTRAIADAVESGARFEVLRSVDHLCDDKTCWMAKDGVMLYRDRHHLNIAGSKFVAQRFRDNLRPW